MNLVAVNLSRINKTHDLQDVTIDNPITLDSYHIKLDMSQKYGSIGAKIMLIDLLDKFPNYSLAEVKLQVEKKSATQNIPFEMIKPSVHNISVEGTSITGQIRTITSQSISGTEIPYVNNGFEDITLNANNY